MVRSTPMSKLEPLSIGAIVDRSASVWRSNWRTLFRLMLGFQLVQFVMLKAFELFLEHTFPALRSVAKSIELVRSDPSGWLPQAGPVLVAAVVVLTLNTLVTQLAGVAVSAFVYPRVTTGETPTVTDALTVARRRFGATVGMFVLSLGWTGIAGVVFLLPAAGALGAAVWARSAERPELVALFAVLSAGLIVVGVLALFLWFLIRFVLTSQVLAVEPVSALACFRRTSALSSGRVGAGFAGLVKGRLMVLISIIAFILMVIGLMTGAPELIVMGVYGAFSPTSGGVAPQALVVPAQLVQVAAGAIAAPLYIVFQVVFYVDMRVRREGLDLELLAARSPT